MADVRRSSDDLVVRPGDTGEPRPGDEPAPELPLLDPDDAAAFLRKWDDVQARFVDDPQAAVSDGDRLVTELLQALATRFAAHRHDLEQSSQRGTDVGTEQLRLALQSYRSLFERLLSSWSPHVPSESRSRP